MKIIFIKIFDFISATFNNREIALFMWAIITIIWMLSNKKIKESLQNVLKLFFGKKIFSIVLKMIFYNVTIIAILYYFKLWDFSLTKDTIYWIFGTSLIMMLNANKAIEDRNFFRSTIKDNLKLVLILQFLINLYCFSLIFEICFLPLMIFLVIFQTFTESNEEHIKLHKASNVIINIYFLIYIIFSIYYLITEWNNYLTFNNLRSFLLTPMLTLIYLPFIYFLALFMNYETIFVRLKITTPDDKSVQRYAKIQIIKYALLSLSKLNNFSKNVPVYAFNSKDDIRVLIDEYKLKSKAKNAK